VSPAPDNPDLIVIALDTNSIEQIAQRIAEILARAPAPETPAKGAMTFHAFASERLAGRHGEITARTLEYERWALTHHLLPYFADWPLSAFDIPAVDGYRHFKLQQAQQRRDAIASGSPMRDENDRLLRPLSAVSINKTLDVLQSILALAVEYEHLASNPAAGRRRRASRSTSIGSTISRPCWTPLASWTPTPDGPPTTDTRRSPP
jgi:hypothetical protein